MEHLLPKVVLAWLQQSGNPARTAAAQGLSAAYRAGQSSSASGFDLAAYLAARLPATYAASAHVLAELITRWPAFAPHSLIDLGAGPGTAAWAAAAHWPAIAKVTLLEQLPAFRHLARELCHRAESPALRQAAIEAFDLTQDALPGKASLVVAAYSLIELPESHLPTAAAKAWAAAEQALVIIEPGTPRAFERLRQVRSLLLEHGARLLAPCPHGGDCPVIAPDWCHFSVRLPRSRAHMQAKAAQVPFEDEKFCYLVATRQVVDVPRARIIRPPLHRKHGVEFDLCSGEGLKRRMVASRDKATYKQVRKLGWGDAFPEATAETLSNDT